MPIYGLSYKQLYLLPMEGVCFHLPFPAQFTMIPTNTHTPRQCRFNFVVKNDFHSARAWTASSSRDIWIASTSRSTRVSQVKILVNVARAASFRFVATSHFGLSGMMQRPASWTIGRNACIIHGNFQAQSDRKLDIPRHIVADRIEPPSHAVW